MNGHTCLLALGCEGNGWVSLQALHRYLLYTDRQHSTQLVTTCATATSKLEIALTTTPMDVPCWRPKTYSSSELTLAYSHPSKLTAYTQGEVSILLFSLVII
jgi:hypothetical protein